MSAGFRKSFLGFNCDDVLNYIEKINNDFSIKQRISNEKIEDLENDCENLKSTNEQLSHQIEELNSKLYEFEKRSAEIEALSEKIGKLYLVSKTNAQTIIENANESSRLALEEVNKNISALETAQVNFEDLKNRAVSGSALFAGEIAELEESLIKTKETIKQNVSEIESCNEAVTIINE